MPLAPDPADKAAADQFQPAPTARRTGGMTLDEWLVWLDRYPMATLPAGVGGMLAAEILRLRNG
jgi:predicted ABC-type sugar transport system permease subunit